MPIKPDISQAILATPTIGMGNAVRVDLAPTVNLQRGLRGVWDDFGVHAIATLGQTNDKSFATCSTPALWAKEGLICFKFALGGRLSCTGLSHTEKDTLLGGAEHRKPGQYSLIGSC